MTKKFLKNQLEKIKLSSEEISEINITTKKFLANLNSKLKKKKIKADVFIGGSLAKKTLIKKTKQDVDIFVRFDETHRGKDISKLLGKVLNGFKKIHGSRDYYQKEINNITLEVVPTLKISKPENAENITDLSYFHVNYILKKSKKKKLADEIILAKSFVHAQNCYGAEGYIRGFSGYGLELLVSHYKTFLKFIKAVAELKDKLIIDDMKFYKGKNILYELNQAKLESPIILIDPTFKERNALAGLSNETFLKFQKSCKKFLKKPSKDFFIKKNLIEKFRKDKNLKIIEIKTNRQKGDIAGTKSRKFFEFIIHNLKKEFEMKKQGFEYNKDKNSANCYFVLDKKKDELIKGPPITDVKNLTGFKKAHKNTFIKNNFAYVKVKHNLSFEKWFNKFKKKEKKIIKGMSIKDIKVILI